MTYNLNFVQDSLGHQLAVQLSIKDWRKIEKRLKEAEFLSGLRNDLDEAFEDVRLHQAGRKKLKTARELLAEM